MDRFDGLSSAMAPVISDLRVSAPDLSRFLIALGPVLAQLDSRAEEPRRHRRRQPARSRRRRAGREAARRSSRLRHGRWPATCAAVHEHPEGRRDRAAAWTRSTTITLSFERIRRDRPLPAQQPDRHDLLRLRDHADGRLLGELPVGGQLELGDRHVERVAARDRERLIGPARTLGQPTSHGKDKSRALARRRRSADSGSGEGGRLRRRRTARAAAEGTVARASRRPSGRR